jgi:hypothetical protein
MLCAPLAPPEKPRVLLLCGGLYGGSYDGERLRCFPQAITELSLSAGEDAVKMRYCPGPPGALTRPWRFPQ